MLRDGQILFNYVLNAMQSMTARVGEMELW